MLTHASSEQPIPSNCGVPFDLLGMCEQGANPTPFHVQNQGRLSHLNDPASSSVPDHGGETSCDDSALHALPRRDVES